MKTTRWMQHLNRYRRSHPDLSLKECMQEASATYTKDSPTNPIQNLKARYRAASGDPECLATMTLNKQTETFEDIVDILMSETFPINFGSRVYRRREGGGMYQLIKTNVAEVTEVSVDGTKQRVLQKEAACFGLNDDPGFGSSWKRHLKTYRASHPGMSLKECMKGASATYRKDSKLTKTRYRGQMFEFIDAQSGGSLTLDGLENLNMNFGKPANILWTYTQVTSLPKLYASRVYKANNNKDYQMVNIGDGKVIQVSVDGTTVREIRPASLSLSEPPGMAGPYLQGAPVPQANSEQQSSCMKYKKLRDIYTHDEYGDFRPPQWVEDECASLLAKYASLAKVLYVQGDSLNDVKRLALEREPVNIAMGRMYDIERLQAEFGYRYGAYAELSNSGFPPQIAISCVTPVQDPNTPNRVEVAVVNLIGLAFDIRLQPDYQKLIKDGQLADENKPFVRNFMIQAYTLAFRATELAGRKVLCVSPIGNVSFKPPGYTTPEFEAEFVWPAVEAAHQLFSDIKVERALFGKGRDDYNVPGCFFNGGRWSKNLNERMFVNAWDCWSMLGNGNKEDGSADGFWGRSSAISLLGWPGSNPTIAYEAVQRT